MVAYNFKTAFHSPIIAGTKRQTVRHAGKKRHARPGELVQIYAGLRTKHARKLIADPICTRLAAITIPVGREFDRYVGGVEIDGIPLSDDELTAFALADGFAGSLLADPIKHFGRFWLLTHGAGLFEGVVVYWEPAP